MTLEQIRQSASFVHDRACFDPEIGIILGTGLGGVVDHIEIKASIDYSDIPNFPVSTVEGHHGRLIFGLLGGRRVVAMQGRFHYYEGYTPRQVVFPVRVMKLLGIRYLFVSNASGGVNSAFRTGDLMVITDHINLIPNPLVGPNIDELGPRFPDMNDAYDPTLIKLAGDTAARLGIKLQYGCYVGGTGPTFETQKEYGYFKAIGGDTVGMSTTPEVIAARHMQIPVFGMSVITNVGLSGEKSTHEEVQREGARAAVDMTRLFVEMIKALDTNP
ncbi:MAG: purine-nucleoside phosphorylase [Rikenellaceae bacterium]|nr:purine-nucleoside phosphorylase [Rikenellaceae bacterium]